jgi:hypothetical protein
MLLLALVAILSLAGLAQACLEYDLVWDPKTQLSTMSVKDGGREVCGFNNWYIGKSNLFPIKHNISTIPDARTTKQHFGQHSTSTSIQPYAFPHPHSQQSNCIIQHSLQHAFSAISSPAN